MGYTTIASSRAGIRVETRYFVPLGETLEVWRTRVTNERAAPARLSLFGTVEFCLWDAQDDATNFQRNYSIGEVEVEDGVIYHKTEYRERRDHFAYFACSGTGSPASTPRATRSSARIAVGTGRSPSSAGRRRAPSPTAGSRSAPTTSRSSWPPARHGRSSFVLGYAENPRDAKFDPPGSQTIDKRRIRPIIDAVPRSSRRRDGVRALSAERWDGWLGAFQVETRQRAPRPDGQRLERVPVHGHVQPVALRVAVRVRDRARHGLPRLEPGPARVRPHGPRARARADPRHRRDPAADRRRVPPVPAADQARQRRRRVGVQRRSGLARAGRRGLPQGDRRPRDPRRAGRLRQRPGQRATARRSPPAGDRLHAGAARPARPAAHRARGLERLPQPQLLLGHARRVVPDHPEPRGRRRRVGLHRRPVRRRRERAGGDRGPPRTRPPRPRACGPRSRRDDRGRRRARLGRRVVPAGLRLLRRADRLRCERRGPDLHRAAGHLRHGRDRAR